LVLLIDMFIIYQHTHLTGSYIDNFYIGTDPQDIVHDKLRNFKDLYSIQSPAHEYTYISSRSTLLLSNVLKKLP
jgi:hypothetical protein